MLAMAKAAARKYEKEAAISDLLSRHTTAQRAADRAAQQAAEAHHAAEAAARAAEVHKLALDKAAQSAARHSVTEPVPTPEDKQTELIRQLERTVSSLQSQLHSLARDNETLHRTCEEQRAQLRAYRESDEAMDALMSMNPFVKPSGTISKKGTKRKCEDHGYIVAKRSHTVPVEADVQPGDKVVARMLPRKRWYKLFGNEECTKPAYEWTKDDIEQTMPAQRVQFNVEAIVDGRARVSVIAPELHKLTQGVYFLEHGSYIEVGKAQHAFVKTMMETGEVETCVVRKERLQHVFNFSIERDGEMLPCHYPACPEYVEPQNRVRFCIAKEMKSSPGRMEFIGYYDENNTFQPVLGTVSIYDMVPLRDALGENSGVTRFGRRVGASTCV